MDGLKREQMLLVCDCGDVSHQLVFTVDSYDGEETEVFAEVHLAPLPFWKRLAHGIMYIFGRRSRFGEFDEICLNRKEHLEKLRKVVDALSKTNKSKEGK